MQFNFTRRKLLQINQTLRNSNRHLLVKYVFRRWQWSSKLMENRILSINCIHKKWKERLSLHWTNIQLSINDHTISCRMWKIVSKEDICNCFNPRHQYIVMEGKPKNNRQRIHNVPLLRSNEFIYENHNIVCYIHKAESWSFINLLKGHNYVQLMRLEHLVYHRDRLQTLVRPLIETISYNNKHYSQSPIMNLGIPTEAIQSRKEWGDEI